MKSCERLLVTDVLTASAEVIFRISFSTLKMTTAEAVETSVTNSLFEDHTNLDDLPSRTCTEFPGFIRFTLMQLCLVLDMLRTLLEKHAPVEEYVNWMDNIIERRVMKVSD